MELQRMTSAKNPGLGGLLFAKLTHVRSPPRILVRGGCWCWL